MGNNSNNNNGHSVSPSVAGGLFGAITTGFSNLWAAKERRKSQQWGEKMFDKETAINRQNADLAYQREISMDDKMAELKKAGLNPYGVFGNSYSAPIASSASTKAGPMAPGDFSAIGQIPQAVMQMKIMQAQKENIDADTKQKLSNTTGQDIANKYAGQLNELQIANMTQMTRNAEETQKLLKEQINLTNAQNLEKWIDNQYRAAQNAATLAKTEAEKIEIDKNVKLLDATIGKIKAEVLKISQDISVGKMTVKQGEAMIQKMLQEVEESKTRQGFIKEQTQTEKRNRDPKRYGMMAPAKALADDLYETIMGEKPWLNRDR